MDARYAQMYGNWWEGAPGAYLRSAFWGGVVGALHTVVAYRMLLLIASNSFSRIFAAELCGICALGWLRGRLHVNDIQRILRLGVRRVDIPNAALASDAGRDVRHSSTQIEAPVLIYTFVHYTH